MFTSSEDETPTKSNKYRKRIPPCVAISVNEHSSSDLSDEEQEEQSHAAQTPINSEDEPVFLTPTASNKYRKRRPPCKRISVSEHSSSDESNAVYQTPIKRRYRKRIPRLIEIEGTVGEGTEQEETEPTGETVLSGNNISTEEFNSSELSGIDDSSHEIDSNMDSFSSIFSDLDDDDGCDNNLESTNYNQPLYAGSSLTQYSSYVMIILFVLKHSLTTDAFKDLLKLIECHLPQQSNMTTSVYKMKGFLKAKMNMKTPKKHYTCESCGNFMQHDQRCQRPLCLRNNSRVVEFNDLNLEDQLKELFKDGVALYSSSKKGNMWPVYIAINELPPKLRYSKKYILTVLVYCHAEKPNMLTYLDPLLRCLNQLYTYATECRERLLHFSIPVLTGVMGPDFLSHYALLVTSMFLLNKDTITQTDIESSRHLLKDFCRLYPDLYVEKKQTINIHLLRHIPDCVQVHEPLYNYSCFGFESMNSCLKNMVHGTRYVNDQLCFAVGMARCLPDMVKSVTSKGIDDRVKNVLLELHGKVSGNNGEDDISTEYKVLGRKKRIDNQVEYVQQLFEEGQNAVLMKFYRLKTPSEQGIIYASGYNRTSSRKSSVVEFKTQDSVQLGNVCHFLEVDGKDLFAVVNEFIVEDDIISFEEISEATLLNYREQNLCPHISKVINSNSKTSVVKVEKILKKCVMMELGDSTYVSVPPNLVEHN